MRLPSVSRRSFLGGLLTLAVVPAAAALEPAGLSPLERTVERIRCARLHELHRRGTAWGVITAIQPLHAASITREQRHRLVRLAFLMARRDYHIQTSASRAA